MGARHALTMPWLKGIYAFSHVKGAWRKMLSLAIQLIEMPIFFTKIIIIWTNFKVLTLQSLEGYVGTLERERKVEVKGGDREEKGGEGNGLPFPFYGCFKN